MQKVTAWKDTKGRLHHDAKYAALSDLQIALRGICNNLPNCEKIDTDHLATQLVAFPAIRGQLVTALKQYDLDMHTIWNEPK